MTKKELLKIIEKAYDWASDMHDGEDCYFFDGKDGCMACHLQEILAEAFEHGK